ncbi:hypothetical protein D3C72_1925720 [compost metagenome]
MVFSKIVGEYPDIADPVQTKLPIILSEFTKSKNIPKLAFHKNTDCFDFTFFWSFIRRLGIVDFYTFFCGYAFYKRIGSMR